ncbi:MAG TPA: tetratricopeptide repeat protein [Arenimonas sp.]|uniref:tetratricopeptide repeat protein n=1 Tax=Arenimonas sp. TaxID=1872635 RepID=UPI002C753D2A|nr:tetratricopeptide repeat protein [Arenimonas sp.]HMB55635.1 tetratricopeptide repeat protein [Arenimonas sp.]
MTRSAKLAAVVLGSAALLSSSALRASGTGSGTSMGGQNPGVSAPSFDVNVEFKKGVDALQAQKYKDADRAFGHVLQVIPRDANSNFLQGMARAGLGKPKDALRYYEKAIKFDDNLILAHQERGITLAKLGETDKAKAELEDLRKRATACASQCAQAGDLAAAVPAIEAALGAAPPTSQVAPAASEFLFARADRGEQAYVAAVALINEKRYEEAIVALDASARAFGPHPDILTYLGFVNRKLGRYDIAEGYYRQALAVAPDHLGATEYYGELMVERGDLAGARRMLAKLEHTCSFGCAQADELRRWIASVAPHAS